MSTANKLKPPSTCVTRSDMPESAWTRSSLTSQTRRVLLITTSETLPRKSAGWKHSIWQERR